ncbi:MAG: hypothetical protein ACYS8W_07465 [Planctomycetota bacterium]
MKSKAFSVVETEKAVEEPQSEVSTPDKKRPGGRKTVKHKLARLKERVEFYEKKLEEAKQELSVQVDKIHGQIRKGQNLLAGLES